MNITHPRNTDSKHKEQGTKNVNNASLTFVVALAASAAVMVVMFFMTPLAYAGEDKSRTGIGFDSECLANLSGLGNIAVCGVEREPEPETATLTVCRGLQGEFVEGNTFTVTDTNPVPPQFELMKGECQDVTIGPGMYQVNGPDPSGDDVIISGDCMQTNRFLPQATGEIQSGETQTCTFEYFGP